MKKNIGINKTPKNNIFSYSYGLTTYDIWKNIHIVILFYLIFCVVGS